MTRASKNADDARRLGAPADNPPRLPHPAPGPCPNPADHTPAPRGYLAWHEWADRMAITHTQRRCPACKQWAIWEPRAKPAARASRAPQGPQEPTGGHGAGEGRESAAEGRTEARVSYEIEAYNDGWSIPIHRTDHLDDARAHEEGLPPVSSSSTRIVRVTREVIQ